MPQINRTTNDLIVNALQLIGEISPDEIPSSAVVAKCLYLLNDLLDYFSVKGILIPFINELTFNITAGKSDYTISNATSADVIGERIVELDYVTLVSNASAYPCRIINRSQLYNISRSTQITGRPIQVILDRQPLFTKLRFYPSPDMTYECQVRGKFMLDSLELFDNLDEIPRYMFRFLRYALARELLSEFPSANWSPINENEYADMFASLKATSDISMAIFADNTLNTNTRYGTYPDGYY